MKHSQQGIDLDQVAATDARCQQLEAALRPAAVQWPDSFAASGVKPGGAESAEQSAANPEHWTHQFEASGSKTGAPVAPRQALQASVLDLDEISRSDPRCGRLEVALGARAGSSAGPHWGEQFIAAGEKLGEKTVEPVPAGLP